jgi:hypothetical protein
MQTPTPEKPKIALVFYGLLRSIQYTLPNLQKQVFEMITNSGYEYDIYCHNYYFPPNHKYNNPRAREYNINLDPNAYKLLNPKYYISDNQVEIAEQLNLPSYRTCGDPWPKTGFKTLDNYLLAMYSRKKITELLAQNITSEPINHTYTAIIFLRSDVLFEKPLPITKLLKLLTDQESLRLRSCLIPNFHHWLGGLNDRMFISKPELALEYGMAFDLLLSISKERKLHSEQINKYIIQEVCKATPVLVPIFFARVRANGNILNEDYCATDATF